MNNADFNEFEMIINDIITNKQVLKMKNYRQHCDTNTYDHCYNAAKYCYKICKKLNLDYKSATRAAMLHDFFLYDWRTSRKTRKYKSFHAFVHGKVAYENASELFLLNEKEKDIIIKHMWPVSFDIPRSREAFILTFVDKYCAISEVSSYIFRNLSTRRAWNYAYVLIYSFICKFR